MAPVELVDSQRAAAGASALPLQPLLSSGAGSAAPVQPEAPRGLARGLRPGCEHLGKGFFCAARNSSADLSSFGFDFVAGGHGECALVTRNASWPQ